MMTSNDPVRASAQEQLWAEQLREVADELGARHPEIERTLRRIAKEIAAEARGRQQAEETRDVSNMQNVGEIAEAIAYRADPRNKAVSQLAYEIEELAAAEFARGRQQAEQAREDATLGTNPFRTWKQVAQRVGEELSDNGPDGYYEFDPAEWQDWCLEQLGRLAGKPTVAALTQALKDCLVVLDGYPEAGLNPDGLLVECEKAAAKARAALTGAP